MFCQNLLFCYIFIITILFLQTITSHSHANCGSSACGHIRNIRYPFRLTDDPKNCGDSKYELSCQNNITLLYIDSQKYLVQAINHENQTLRLTYPDVEKYNSCSFPQHSIPTLTFNYDRNPAYYYSWGSSISFMSCPFPVSNSSLLVETTKDCFNQSGNYSRHTYIWFGSDGIEDSASFVTNTCRIDLTLMTSMEVEDENNVSLSEIHNSLLYGFLLTFDQNWAIYSSCSILFTCGSSAPVQVQRTIIIPNRRCRWHTDGYCQNKKVLKHVQQLNWIIGPLFPIAVYGVELYLALRILIGMPCMLGFLIYIIRRRRHSSMFDLIEVFLQSKNNLIPIRYSYPQVKKMTRGFRQELGKGGFGSVYKGKLRSGNDVAVKLLTKPKANGQDFINEVATIGRIHHVNVVKLVGYCAERSKRALVYDFMINGSLDKYISNHSLSWDRKYEIAIGVARGIEYLHKGCNIQILHFDIKPHNILLDDNFIPKISDFGLAKFCSTEDTRVTLTAARGTIGYVAPELINRNIGEVSYKADVYSFGMLLMEMIGLKDMVPADDNESSKYFPSWIYDRLNKGKDIEIGNVDEYNDEDARKTTRKMTIVGLWCIQMSPSDRPSMSEVLRMLEGDGESLQIPTLQPFQSPQNNWEIESNSDDSFALLGSGASMHS